MHSCATKDFQSHGNEGFKAGTKPCSGDLGWTVRTFKALRLALTQQRLIHSQIKSRDFFFNDQPNKTIQTLSVCKYKLQC